jgi:YHS domain-containing protein
MKTRLKIFFSFFIILSVVLSCSPKKGNVVTESLLPIALKGEPSASVQLSSQAASVTPVVTSPENENPEFPTQFSSQGASFQTTSASGEVIKIDTPPGGATTITSGLVDANGNFIQFGTFYVNASGDIVDTNGTVNNSATSYIDINGNIVKDGKPSGNINGANIFDNFTIVFGSPMDKASVEANFQMVDSEGNAVQGTFIWNGDQVLEFDPYTELKENTIYTVTIGSIATVAVGITDANFGGFEAKFKTGSSFTTTNVSKVNGTDYNLSSATRGSTIQPIGNSNANLATTLLELVTTVPFPDRVYSIRLYKLGKRGAAPTYIPFFLSICDNTNATTTDDCLKKEGNNFVFDTSLLPTGVSIKSKTTDLLTLSVDNLNAVTPVELRPEFGGNTYYYCINTTGKSFAEEPECNYVRTFSFIYGETATDPNALITDVLSLSMGENALGVLEKLVGRLGAEQFTVEGKSLNQEINVQTERDTTQPLTVDGKTCRATRVGNGAEKFPPFPYLSKIGPFCDEWIDDQKATLKKKDLYKIYQQSEGALRVALGFLFNPLAVICCQYKNEEDNVAYLTYDAKVDVYLQEMKINTTPADVMNADLVPEVGKLAVKLGVRGATGRMVMVLELVSAKMSFLFDILPITIPSDLIGGKYQYTTGFAINKDNPTGAYRNANISTTTSIANHNILIGTSPPTNYFPADDPLFNFKEWNDNLLVDEISDHPDYSVVDSSSSLAQTLAGFINPVMRLTVKAATLQKLPDIQPKVVGGTVKDTVEKVVPNLINTILNPFTNETGYPLAMPNYLPEPFNYLRLNIRGMPSIVNPNLDGDYKALEMKVNGAFTTVISLPGHSKPESLQGSNSYIKMLNAGVPGTLIRSANKDKGDVLIAMNPDGINKALFDLWKEGSLNLKVDKTSIKLIKDVATAAGADTSVLTLSESLLNAESILAVFAPQKSDWSVFDATTSTLRKINATDEVFVKTSSIHPVVVSIKDSDTEAIPELSITISDLIIEVRGKSVDTDYLISKIRTNMTIKSDISIKDYVTPKNIKVNFNGKEIAYTSEQSVKVSVPVPEKDEDVSKGVYYSLEVLKGQQDNPLGLNPTKMETLIRPLVRTLILPLVNNLIGDIPLPPLKACGLRASGVDVLKIPATNAGGRKYIFAKAGLGEDTVPFTGDCSVKTILDIN